MVMDSTIAICLSGWPCPILLITWARHARRFHHVEFPKPPSPWLSSQQVQNPKIFLRSSGQQVGVLPSAFSEYVHNRHLILWHKTDIFLSLVASTLGFVQPTWPPAIHIDYALVEVLRPGQKIMYRICFSHQEVKWMIVKEDLLFWNLPTYWTGALETSSVDF